MKIGILSFAHLHAESYIQNLRDIEGVELMGIADEDLERGPVQRNERGDAEAGL